MKTNTNSTLSGLLTFLHIGSGNPIVRAHKQAKARAHIGSSHRLTESERAGVIYMLNHPAFYSVREIATKYKVSRAAIYQIKESEGLTTHTRASRMSHA